MTDLFMSQEDLGMVLGVPSTTVRKAYSALFKASPLAWVTMEQAQVIKKSLSENLAASIQMALMPARLANGSFIRQLLEKHSFWYTRNRILLDWTYSGDDEAPKSKELFYFRKEFGAGQASSVFKIVRADLFTGVSVEPFGISALDELALQDHVSLIGMLPGDPEGAARMQFCVKCGLPMVHPVNGCIFCKAKKYLV